MLQQKLGGVGYGSCAGMGYGSCVWMGYASCVWMGSGSLCVDGIWIPGTGIQPSPELPGKAHSTRRSSSFLLLCWDWCTLTCAIFPFHLLAFALEEGKKKALLFVHMPNASSCCFCRRSDQEKGEHGPQPTQMCSVTKLPKPLLSISS